MARRASADQPVREALPRLREAAAGREPVSLGSRRTNSPHEFYRYPGRFSPAFARAAIDAFTQPGDLVLDPFVGGGTTLVEARLTGRAAIGADLNRLATFVSRAKTTELRPGEAELLRWWASELAASTKLTTKVDIDPRWKGGGYLRYLDSPLTWRIRNLIALTLDRLPELPSERARRVARCAVLRTGQWALDMREAVPTANEFRQVLSGSLISMASVAEQYARQVRKATTPALSSVSRPLLIIGKGLPELAAHAALRRYPPPRLMLTSPPYPGVYVLYHRWKLLGRWETPAPYWVTNTLDGRSLAHYTMGERQQPGLTDYFKRLAEAYTALAKLADRRTWLVQMVGFKSPTDQLPRFLETMEGAGFTEVRLDMLANRPDGRLWRHVPGRRWWNEADSLSSGRANTAQEVVLVHRKAHP